MRSVETQDTIAESTYDSPTLGVVRRLRPDVPPQFPSDTMTTDDTRADLVRKALRKRAERMIARYVRLEFSMRSAVGRMALDETRLLKKQSVDIDFESATSAEVLDAIYAQAIRRAVFARPEAPIVFGSQKHGDKYERLRRVIPAKDVAQIVRPKSKHGSSDGGCDVREWRATVAQKLARLPKAESSALLEVANIRVELGVIVNQLAAARSESGRLKRGGRDARNLKRHAEERVSELKSRETMLSDRRDKVLRGDLYLGGLDHLVTICTVSAEVEAYCFADESVAA